jgi:hypothetical protein
MKRRGIAAKHGRVESIESSQLRACARMMADDQGPADRGLSRSPIASPARRETRGGGRPRQMKNKIVSTDEAIAIIRDGDTLAFSGFVGSGTPDELIELWRSALRRQRRHAI